MIPLWIDCDPGQDDIVAITFGAHDPHFDLVGVSTTHGNASMENVTQNALKFLTVIKKPNVPVFPGAARPLNREPEYCPEVHGPTGLNGSDRLPQPAHPARKPEEFFPYLKEQIESHKGELAIAAIGPLTNIAVFFTKYPELRSQIKCLSIMGGGLAKFNKNGCSEFNVFCDPDAAKIVFEDPVLSERILLAPLDLTSTIRASAEIRQRILGDPASASEFRKLMSDLVQYFYNLVKVRQGPGYVGPSVHDPVAIATILQYTGATDLGIKWKTGHLTVQVGGENDGKMEYVPSETGSRIAEDIDRDQFWNVLLDSYARVDQDK
ncbi:hypothetical protein OGAPHI_001714 [Ogataea philodendri]|uniref:Inosine/uridine-preferring nucleoside hydrolase domain-containing protein n=1 Tax=Ogataea philodendri TaxID=1378263 RepID=A0A9P8PAG0_9ASCO|nr:uncharacterized protein OGAPHI_001714 [Ogataea philodendri]KAH3667960.1 hypothetical protein OGAPHI_001714 [Ogataea philodendri]